MKKSISKPLFFSFIFQIAVRLNVGSGGEIHIDNFGKKSFFTYFSIISFKLESV